MKRIVIVNFDLFTMLSDSWNNSSFMVLFQAGYYWLSPFTSTWPSSLVFNVFTTTSLWWSIPPPPPNKVIRVAAKISNNISFSTNYSSKDILHRINHLLHPSEWHGMIFHSLALLSLTFRSYLHNVIFR